MATKRDTEVLQVTAAAAKKMGEVINEHEGDGSLLRVMVMPGSNGGVQYMFGVENEPRKDDLIINTETVDLLVDSESVPILDGAEIDYVDGLMRSGFVISSPNIHGGGGCGCGGGGCGCGGH